MPNYLRWLRSKIGRRKTILVYGVALIRDAAGRLLFQRRTDFDWWGLPGGVLELGESLEACAIREAVEETGWQVQPTRLVGVYTSPRYDVRYPNGDEVQQFSVAFECRIVGGDSQPDGLETIENRFFGETELPAMHLPIWYRDMAVDCFAARPPRYDPPHFAASTTDDWKLMRQLVGKERLVVVGAGAIITDAAGRLLLGLRREGVWGIPAGLMELGESISATLLREAQEEMGVQLTLRELIGIYTGAEYFHTYEDGNEAQIVSTLFRAEIAGGTLTPDGVETLALGWFSPKALPPMTPRHGLLVQTALGTANVSPASG